MKYLIPSLLLALIAPLAFAADNKAANQKAPDERIAPWKHEPVTLEDIDAAGVAELVKNPTNKLRLINVWATWCVPCVAEFPELVKLSKEITGGNFEVITISMDHPRREKAKALKFLEDRHAGMSAAVAATVTSEGRKSNNYIYSQLAQEPLMQALDSEWPGPIPHTVLVAPGGQILWRHNGEFNPAILGRKIAENLKK
jgi:thiol-disulfide isomerase/thioredoxin